MHRSDFQRIAAAARVIRPMVAEAIYEELIDQLALACSDQATRFNYDKFVDACRGNNNE